MVYQESKRIAIVIIGASLIAVALNFFLINANVYSSGFTGAAQLLSSILNDFFNVELSTGIILFLLNVPVIILGWFKLGRSFTFYSILSVFSTTFFLEILPIIALTDDIILNTISGGVIIGVGVGMTMKIGASTGGLDIVAMILSRLKDRPVGIYFLLLNALIVFTAGVLYEPENALYTMLGLYITTMFIDIIHTRHEKVTAMIITHKADEMQAAIHAKMIRGITLIPVIGAYSKEGKQMLYIVLTRYELFDLEQVIQEVDPSAFTNIVQTIGVLGLFRREGDEYETAEINNKKT